MYSRNECLRIRLLTGYRREDTVAANPDDHLHTRSPTSIDGAPVDLYVTERAFLVPGPADGVAGQHSNDEAGPVGLDGYQHPGVEIDDGLERRVLGNGADIDGRGRVEAGGQAGGSDAANLLKPALAWAVMSLTSASPGSATAAARASVEPPSG